MRNAGVSSSSRNDSASTIFRKRTQNTKIFSGKEPRRKKKEKFSGTSVRRPRRSKQPAAKHNEEQAAASEAGESKTFRMTCSEPERETEKVDQLYQAFVQAKQKAGEETGRLSRSSFNEFVLKKTKELQKQKKCRDVEYVVEVVEGQVKLKALVKS